MALERLKCIVKHSFVYRKYVGLYTIEPVYNGHPRDLLNVAVKWPVDLYWKSCHGIVLGGCCVQPSKRPVDRGSTVLQKVPAYSNLSRYAISFRQSITN